MNSRYFTFVMVMMAMIITLSGGSRIYASAENNDIDERSLIDEAHESIKQAELSGANISDQIVEFNNAIKLINEAALGSFDSQVCTGSSECIDQANQILQSVITQSNNLEKQSEQASIMKLITSYAVIAPIGAFVAAIIVVYCYMMWKSRKINGISRMEVKRK
jgi:hypothetical protein